MTSRVGSLIEDVLAMLSAKTYTLPGGRSLVWSTDCAPKILPEDGGADIYAYVFAGPGRVLANQTRGNMQDDIPICVGVIAKVDDSTLASVDPLLVVVDEIANYLRRTEIGDATWLSTENDPVCSVPDLETSLLFKSVIIATFRVSVAA